MALSLSANMAAVTRVPASRYLAREIPISRAQLEREKEREREVRKYFYGGLFRYATIGVTELSLSLTLSRIGDDSCA